MKKRLLIIVICIISSCTLKEKTQSNPECTACSGGSYCGACKNCKYCKHCAVYGGTCSVCK